jgi:hypothetical protein
MNALFPFGFPWPTAIYLALYVVTAAIYMIFMQYVVAGAIVLVVGYVAPGARRRALGGSSSPTRSGLGVIVKVVRDWLPAVLGLAIATAIAPLLFLRILYTQQFDTTSLLLFSQFVLLVPVLIAACYMLYLVKSEALSRRWLRLRGLVASVAFACFFYTAWVWTENHVLSLHEEAWKIQHKSSIFIYRNAEIWPRLGYWITASFTTLAAMLGWQLHWGWRLHDPANLDLAVRRLRALALLGLATSAAEAWLWQLWLPAPARAPLFSMLAAPYGLLALTGMGIQVAGWLPVRTASVLSTRRLALISTGVCVMILGALVVREARRLAGIDITALFDAHHQAAQVGGMGMFLTFFGVNAAAIVGCVLIVKRALRPLA